MRALVRRPSPSLAEGQVTHIERRPVDHATAYREWESYVSVLEAAGWSTIEVDAAPDLPDSAFIEDAVVVHGDVAIVTAPGSDTRTAETLGARRTVLNLGMRVVDISAADPAARLDGGDVLKVGTTWYCGRGGRTNPAGVAALRNVMSDYGIAVIAVPLTKALHLKSAVTALPDGTIIGYLPVVDDPGFFPHFVPMPEEPGAHVVDLGDGRLLMSRAAPRSAELIADRGYDPVLVDIGEFEKLEGCVTCLSVRLRG